MPTIKNFYTTINYQTRKEDECTRIILNSIYTDDKQRNRGYGTVAMVNFLYMLDVRYKSYYVKLSVLGNKKFPTEELVKWYMRFGFIEIPDTVYEMILDKRIPSASK